MLAAAAKRAADLGLTVQLSMSAAVTTVSKRRATSIAVVATPQPMSSTRCPGPKSAKPKTSSVAARPPGWMTRLPSTARKAYGSSRATSGRVDAVGMSDLRLSS
jgi:hypothetical protein